MPKDEHKSTLTHEAIGAGASFNATKAFGSGKKKK
jgi:hypothetical protein